jgi:hypothetical protein
MVSAAQLAVLAGGHNNKATLLVALFGEKSRLMKLEDLIR